MTSIKRIVYSTTYLNQWDTLVENSRNGTFLNSRRFLNYHPPEKFKDSSLLFFKKESLIAVIPAAIIKKNEKKIFFSHPGSTYGGIIVNNSVKISDLQDIVNEMISYCKENDLDEIIIKTSPRIYHSYPTEEIDFILFKNGFKITQRDLSTCIDLEKIERSLMIKNTIVAIKQGKKRGVIVEESDDFQRFWDILTENLKKHNSSPTHSVEEIKLLKSLFPKKIKLFTTLKDERIIGGSVIFLKKNQTLHTQYIGNDYQFEKMRPINVLIEYLINYGKKKGLKYLNFGVSTEGFGETINWGLFRFKEGFGGRGIIHELYHLNLKEK